MGLAGLLLAGLLACGGEEKTGSAAPAGAVPPPSPEVPAGIRIEVEVDGKPAPPIDSARLRRTQPDYRDDVGRSWRLETLLGAPYVRPNAVVEVETAEGSKTVLPRRGVRRRWEPVLVLNRRGELLVSLRKRDDAGTRVFQGRGGKRGRPGGLRRQIRNVTNLRVYERERVAAPQPGRRMQRKGDGEAGVAVFVEGERAATWTAADLNAVETLALAGPRGGGPRAQAAWSLREVVQTLLGSDYVVTQMQGRGGRLHELQPEEWYDLEKIPALRLNRRGGFKFEWLSASGKPTRGAGLWSVTEIHLQSGVR